MRVVVWGINYAPEFTGIAPHNVALCEFLNAKGHEVLMVTGFPYYPSWVKRSEDQGRFYQTDRINGVSVHRCWQFVPKRVSALGRILHEASFVFTSTLRLLTLSGADAYLIISPPLLLGVGGWVIGKIKNAPFVFHVQDLQPDAAVGLGMLKANWFVRVLYALESFIYRHANLVSGITRGMLDRFRSKGVSEERLFYFPNTIALDGASPPPVRGEFRRRYGYRLDEFLAIYAGNIGAKQDLEILVQTASLLTDQRIRIIICGDGAQRDPLTRRIEELKLPNIRMLPLQVGSDYRALLIDADVCLITQHAGGGNSFFPSKLLGLLAESKAVVTVASPQCELALAVTEGKFGINVPPGHPEELADLLQSLARHPERLAEYGGAGRRYVEQFARENVLREFTDKLELLGR